MEKRRRKRTVFSYFVIAYLLVVIAFTLYRYFDESKKLDEVIRIRLQNGAAMIKYVMPRGYFDRAVNQYSIPAVEYQKCTEVLSQATWENKFKYLYAIKEEQGKFYFIAASLSRKELSSRQFEPYWQEYTEAPPALFKAHRTHKAVFDKVTDRWGTFYSVFYPEYSPSGQYYIVGADYDFKYIKSSLSSILYSAILQALTLLILLFLIYVTLSRLQKHYIRKLQYANSANEAAPIGVMSIQLDGQIEYVNPVFAGLIGLSVEALEGQNIHSDLGFYKNDELINRIRICLTRQISWQGEFLNVSLSGQEYWVNAIINYIKSEQEGKAMLNVFAADNTAQMKSRISLAQHNKVLRFLSEAIHNLLANPDLSSTLREVLAQYGQNLGKSQVTILRKVANSYEIEASWQNSATGESSIPTNMFSQIQKPLYTDWEANLENKKIVGGESYEFPISLVTLAHIQDPGILHICPVFCDEKYWGFIISLQTQREESIDDELEHTVMLSISDSIGSALKRNEIDAALHSSVDAKSRFMSSMSHEIRTPLNGVLGMINLLESTPLNDEQKDYINAIRVSGRLLMNLINNILDVSRIEAGKSFLRNDPVGLSSCIQAAVNIVSYELKQKEIELRYAFDPRLPKVIQGDETRLKQILVNLLHNAIKFTNQGEIRIITKRLNLKQIEFTVEDTGIGMTAEQVEHIFEPFYQAGPLAQKLKGTGLGLAISKQLVEMMHGEIKVESRPNEGTSISFTIELPILEDCDEYSQQMQEQLISQREQANLAISPISIVVLPGADLDDKVLQNYLISRGYNHITADNWQSLLSYLKTDDIKLAVINLAADYPDPEAFILELKKAYINYPDKYWLILSTKSTGLFVDAENPADKVLVLPKPLDFEQTLLYLRNIFEKEINRQNPELSDLGLDQR